MTSDELAYIAGFFDGEGSVTIHTNCKPSLRGKVPNHTLQVSIGNTDPRVLLWIHSNFGGNICYRKKVSPKWRKVAQWSIRTGGAALFLQAIYPFVRMKRDQIEIACAYQATKRRHGPAPVNPSEVAWREEQRKQIRELNAREWVH